MEMRTKVSTVIKYIADLLCFIHCFNILEKHYFMFVEEHLLSLIFAVWFFKNLSLKLTSLLVLSQTFYINLFAKNPELK